MGVLHADSLLWDFGDGTTIADIPRDTVRHRYADTGVYQVTLIASRHCMADTAIATLHIVSPDTTGIAQFSIINSQLSVFPNPSATLPVIMLNGKDVSHQATVTTPDGRTFPYSALHDDAPAGVYFIRVNADGKSLQSKFIKL